MAADATTEFSQFAGMNAEEAEAYTQQAATLRRQSAALLTRATQARRSTQTAARQRAPRATPRARRSRRVVRRATARGPDDREPQPPLTRLGAEERRGLRLLIDQARRGKIAALECWRTCAKCHRDQEPDEFSRGAKYCRSCERERVADYRRRKAVAA